VALIVTYLVLALIPALVASRKGRSALGFFLLAVVLTPLLSLIVALIIDPGREHPTTKEKTAAWEAAYRAEAERKYRAG
jgi:NADH:ubiquinone oxidoreductase subunit 3 (subunit A)